VDEPDALPPLALDDYPRLAARARVQPDRLSGEPALLYPEGVLMLNPTGAAIVALCDGQRDVAGVIEALAASYNAPAEEIAPDVIEYLERLREKCLIDIRKA
jgi:pyrroloquinoline quinone biosynthesis protein D